MVSYMHIFPHLGSFNLLVDITNLSTSIANSFYLVGDLYDSLYIIESKKWACMDLLKCIFQRKYKTPGIQVKVVEKCIY